MVHWGFIFVFSFLVALITILPEIYSRFKAKNKWTPLNSPPYMIGDDYHYFSILNNIHRRFLNLFYGTHFTSTPLTANSCFQLFGYSFNLLPYHLGYRLEDRRMGVVFVRIWNRVFLGFFASLFAYYLFQSIQINPTTPLLTLSFISFFILYPGPFNLFVTGSIGCQINNSRHIYDNAHANELTRSMYCETTGPLLLASLAVTMGATGLESVLKFGVIGSVAVVLFFFTYIPVALYLSVILIFLSIMYERFSLAILFGAIMICVSATYYHFISKDEVGKELFSYERTDSLFKLSRLNLKIFLFSIVPTLFLGLIVPNLPELKFIILYLGSLLFVFTYLFTKQNHQFYRLFGNAANIPLQLIVIVGTISIFVPFFPDWFFFLFTIVGLFVLIYFYYRQSIFLYESHSTLLNENISFENDIEPGDAEIIVAESRFIATNSIEFAYCIDLFSRDETFLRNYSIQNKGYRRHLPVILTNFKLIGYTFEDCEELLTAKVEMGDWCNINNRPMPKGSDCAKMCYEHTIQFLSFNREYNYALIQDGMYNGIVGWTDSYKKLLYEIWQSIDLSEYKELHVFRSENPF